MKKLLGICLMVLCCIKLSVSQDVGLSVDVVDNAKKYLARFGYIEHFLADPVTVKAGIEQLQYFANLKVTGNLNAETLKQIELPRCANVDPKIKIERNRRRRYIHQGSKWRKNLLTWRLVGRGRTLDHETIRRKFKKATEFWSDVANMKFKEIRSGEPDVLVKFVRRDHGDPYAFDGNGGTLAHAFYPHNNKGLSGDVHFDDDEDYTVGTTKGRNLLFVATHELGHTLGMEHSNVQSAVMYPWYVKYTPGFQLDYDDILGIQNLYGAKKDDASETFNKKKTTTTTTTTPTTTTTTTTTRARPTRPLPSNRKCPAVPISTVFYNSYYKLMVLITKNRKIYFVKPKGGIRYGPLKVTNYFPSRRIPGNIDASLNLGRTELALFSGSAYYMYNQFQFVSGPHSIHGNQPGDKNPLNLRFPLYITKIDSAMKWHRNDRIYFYSGPYYWRYDQKMKRFDRGYPKDIQRAWRGLPSRIDVAFSSDEQQKTFFVSGGDYYLLNDNYVRVERYYPEHIGREWLDCGGSTHINRFRIPSPGDFSNLQRGDDP